MSTDPNLLQDLVARGLVQDTTDLDALAARLQEPITVYYGVDPTAPSLHVGNLIGLLVLARFQRAGHKPLPLAGGATGMIGDPSGKSAERNLLDDDSLAENLAGIVPVLRQFVDFETEPNPAKLLDNRAWTVGLPLLDFLRDVGKHITINQMVAKESVKNRMAGEEGISFTEFTYMLLQAQDFLWLFENEGCEMQVGGSDQWGNISLGVDLIRRRTGEKAHALTWPLLLQKDGSKYGKTAGGETVWLNADKMSPYRFYQAWIQAEDDELPKLLKWLTFLSIDEVDEVVADHGQEPHQRRGQKRLANELTTIVHGADATAGAEQASEVLFGRGSVVDLPESAFAVLGAEIESTALSRQLLDDTDNLVPLLVKSGIATSNGEAGRLLQQNGVSINDDKVGDSTSVGRDQLQHDRYLLIRKGKKTVHLADFGES